MQRMISLAAACAVTALCGAASAQEWISPTWTKPVQGNLAADLFPRFAATIGQSGRATVRCRIESDGHPYLCDVVSEAPHGLGFGAAARVIVASAEVSAARVDGLVVSSTIQTNVRFLMREGDTPFGNWKGPEPSESRLALARTLVETMTETLPPSFRDGMIDGLDFDRRATVTQWIDELMPFDPARAKEVTAIQFARLFKEADLRRLIARQPVNLPSEAAFYEACPDPTPEERAALDELRRRYCDRWECDADPLARPRLSPSSG